MHAVHVTSAAFPAGAVPSRRAGSRAAPRALGRVAAVRSASLNLARDDRDLRAGCAMTAPSRRFRARADAPGPSTSSHRCARRARSRPSESSPAFERARTIRRARPGPPPRRDDRPPNRRPSRAFCPTGLVFIRGSRVARRVAQDPGLKLIRRKALERFTARRDAKRKARRSARRSSPPPRPRRPAPSPPPSLLTLLLANLAALPSHPPPPPSPLLPSS